MGGGGLGGGGRGKEGKGAIGKSIDFLSFHGDFNQRHKTHDGRSAEEGKKKKKGDPLWKKKKECAPKRAIKFINFCR